MEQDLAQRVSRLMQITEANISVVGDAAVATAMSAKQAERDRGSQDQARNAWIEKAKAGTARRVTALTRASYFFGHVKGNVPVRGPVAAASKEDQKALVGARVGQKVKAFGGELVLTD